MNKNLIILIGILMAGIIAYQAYLLGKLQAQKQEQPVAKHEPKVTVEIEKEHPTLIPATHTARSTAPSGNITAAAPLIDEKKIKEDIARVFKDIFGNPKVKEEIQKNMSEMQQQLQEGMSQFQKEIVMMTAQLQKAAQSDPMLKELFQNFKLPKALEFHDAGDHYTLEVDVPDNAKSSVDVKVKKGFLVIIIHQVTAERHEENGVIVEKELKRKKQILVTVPHDADIEKLDTTYNHGKLLLTLPKKSATHT
ncbi:MAG: hypothetical protein DSZ05_01990 [Sulfurospirillum sp.]|nr:MAG: hypothetical protein DSZ05_01990 [Sulfurospirillum sp.]